MRIKKYFVTSAGNTRLTGQKVIPGLILIATGEVICKAVKAH
jgi:hypothetical protein